MAKFQIHGRPEIIEALNGKIPRDGTAPALFLLEAVELYHDDMQVGKEYTRAANLAVKLDEMVPDDDKEAIRYIVEAIDIRHKVESRSYDLVKR